MSRLNSRTRVSLCAVPIGIAMNFIGVSIAHALKIPLYFDSIGTILTAASCGYLPGILVGFFSNVINSISDPITLYYGIISIMIACTAAFCAKRKFFSSIRKSAAAVVVFALIGGGLGSVLTWLLYGQNFGRGVSAPLAMQLYAQGFTPFWAQISADMLLDLADKLITIVLVSAILHFTLSKHRSWYPYYGSVESQGTIKRHYQKCSLHTKIALLITVSGVIIGILTTNISFILYQNVSREHYTEIATGIADLMVQEIPGDQIKTCLSGGNKSEAYLKIQSHLKKIQESFPMAEYFYVYQILPDGCHVVFDLDTDETEGEEVGTVVDFDPSFQPYLEDLFNGQEIAPVISDDQYGWLLTVYRPIFDSAGKCAAYACVDIPMDKVASEQAVFLIRMVSVSFGALLILIWLTIAYADVKLVAPINKITEAADKFAFESKEDRLAACDAMRNLNVSTGDEVENLYLAISKTVTEMADYIGYIAEQNSVISTMQCNVITTFADLVENRDENTGEHIRRTAEYVEILAKQLQTDGKYSDLLTDQYIKDMCSSAPLHDIGKIKIADKILNKPGKLTAEEFDLMKQHAATGRAILEEATQNLGSFSYLNMAADMAGGHHEWWNGSGYPHGLRGTEIPLSARIMAVADVLDALLSKRSYKEALPFDTAAQIIQQESGTHFDPEIVQAFHSAEKELRTVRR